MAKNSMVLFAKKLNLESKWNEMFLENNGEVTPEMSVLGDEIKTVIRSILKEQENPKNIKDLEVHLFAG
jgi:hypothetical protein|tara:strand:- start:1097 stop:1303 length:207 start_codon:yes stop_codon:yes gene_type:complete